MIGDPVERKTTIPAVARRARRDPVAAAQVMASTPLAGRHGGGWVDMAAGPRGGPVRSLPVVSDKTAEQHAVIHACCAIIAGDTSKVPLRVREKNRRGNMVTVHEHELEALLNSESAPGVPANIARFAYAYGLALRGTAAAYAPRDARGNVALIDVLQEGQFSVLRTGRARVYQFTDGDEIQRTAGHLQMVHWRYCSADGWDHRSPVRVACESVALALAGQRAAARHASGHQLRGYVKLADDFEDAAARRLSHQRIKAALDDPDAGGVPILGLQDEIHSLDLSAADAQLLENRAFDREGLAAIFRVPLSKLQVGGATRAAGQQGAIDYVTDGLLHWKAQIEGPLNLGLLTAGERARRLSLSHDFDALMEATTRERIEAAVRATGGPITTIDEGREMNGLPPVPDGSGKLMYPPPNMTRADVQTGGKGAKDE
jgi:HK97 family phage portal protein